MASPDPVDVHRGDRVHWQPVDRDYTISFSDASEPAANPIKVKHGVSDPGHPIKGNRGCKQDPKQQDAYYCKYSVTKDNDPTACADPGVHIIPN
jgi:hypothetical protein